MPPLNPHSKLTTPTVHDYALGSALGEVLGTHHLLRQRSYEDLLPLSATGWLSAEPLPWERRTEGRRVELAEGERWGELFDCAWICLRAELPADLDRAGLVLRVDLNGEALVVDELGQAVQGLTNGSSVFDRSLGEPGKLIVRDAGRFVKGNQLEVWLDAGCNDLFGSLQQGGRIQHLRLCREFPARKALAYDMEVLLDLLAELPTDGAHYHRILHALWQAMLPLRELNDDEVARARAALARELQREAGRHPLSVTAAGHSHIDLAWLWPLRETRRKGARTFATVDDLMGRYPAYRFCASQPQLYDWVRADYPELYARVKSRVAEGRWEPIGAMWVEADNNLASGEALARQFLHGKRFFRQQFGVDTRTLFIPDDFGYSACLPQIMRGAGVDYLLTIKMSWDAHQPFPYHSFNWRGQDGSTVLVHMPPEGDYNSAGLPRSVLKAERNFAEKATVDEFAMLFGIGDGGGGPGEEHLERVARIEKLYGVPATRQGSIQEFFDRLATQRGELAQWDGEMFLHRHQGTFTTQLKSKQYNRQGEFLLREAEIVRAQRLAWRGEAWPAADFERIWKEFLLYQFHDILPGSSITRVYAESQPRYAALMGELEAMLNVPAGRAFVVNSQPWVRSEWMKGEDGWRRVEVPALASAELPAAPQANPPAVEVGEGVLDNGLLRVELAQDGALASVIDVASGREVLSGASNVFHVYHDTGDAWDYPRYTNQRELAAPRLVAREVLSDGPRGVIRQQWSWGQSTISQELALTAGSPLLECATTLDWRDGGTMLRASFELDVPTRELCAGVQYGHVTRPLHTNTAADRGTYEQYAHRWIGLSAPTHGAALFSDTHYGYSGGHGHLEINLLRTPSYPDGQADRGTHCFRYALYPFAGTLEQARVDERSREFCTPLRVTLDQEALRPLLGFDREGGFCLEALKRAEDGEAIVVRLSECYGRTLPLAITPAMPLASAALANLMEEPQVQLQADGAGALHVTLAPFELKTLLLVLRR